MVCVCVSAPVGAGGFPGGAPFGMPGLQELFNDPEVLMAMKVWNQSSVLKHQAVHNAVIMQLKQPCVLIQTSVTSPNPLTSFLPRGGDAAALYSPSS